MGRVWIELTMNAVNVCGTSCCALGVCPEVIPICEQDSLYNTQVDEFQFSYPQYSLRIFPSLDLQKSYTNWTYLFGACWPNDRYSFFK